MPIKYEGDLFRPPSEAKSLIFQATVGCSHNLCTFCAMYKQKKYRIRPLKEIKNEIRAAATCYPGVKRVFLADGNALSIPTAHLLAILETLAKSFPALTRVSLYANTQDLLEKGTADLTRLKQHRLSLIYLGVESGSATVLKAIKKGVTPGEIVQAAARVKEAGTDLSVTVVNGLAGAEGSEEHCTKTAELLNLIEPEYLSLLSLIIVPGTPISRLFSSGQLTALNPWQLLEEIRQMVAGLALTNTIFRTNHASNYLPLKAVLSKDQQKVLLALDAVLAKKETRLLKSEFLRGL